MLRATVLYVALIGFTASCLTTAGVAPRLPKLLPKDLAARFKTPDAKLCETKILGKIYFDEFVCWQGSFAAPDGLSVPFEYYLPYGVKNAPLVLAIPILGGTHRVPRLLCRTLARKGIIAAYLERPMDIFQPTQRAADLEHLIVDGIVRYRAFLDWAASQPEVDSSRIGVAGISMGAFVGTILMAVEPRIKKGFLALPGCDLPQLLLESSEKSITDYLAARRQTETLTNAQITQEFIENFSSDPSVFAPYVDPRGLFVVSARYDTVIPKKYSQHVWELLGEPQRMLIPTGHYSSFMAYPYVAHKMIQHFANNQTAWIKEEFLAASAATQ